MPQLGAVAVMPKIVERQHPIGWMPPEAHLVVFLGAVGDERQRGEVPRYVRQGNWVDPGCHGSCILCAIHDVREKAFVLANADDAVAAEVGHHRPFNAAAAGLGYVKKIDGLSAKFSRHRSSAGNT